MNDRKEFLLKMYEQMFNDINRHILVVWQSIGVIVGAFALLASVEKQIMSLDVAASIVLLITAWSSAHILDASYWYNRNLVIIANIERQFLKDEDKSLIHFYFSDHRKDNKMISHLEVQWLFSVFMALLISVYHFTIRVVPGLNAPLSNFEPERALPYLLLVVLFEFLRRFRLEKNRRYAEFLQRSPGKDISSGAIGAIGHGQ